MCDISPVTLFSLICMLHEVIINYYNPRSYSFSNITTWVHCHTHSVIGQQHLILRQKKIVVSGNVKMLSWRYGAGFFSRTRLKPKPESLMRQSLTQCLKRRHVLNDWSNKGNQMFHRRPFVSSTVCPLRMQVTWCYWVFRNQLFCKYLQTIFQLANLRNV